MRVDVMTKMRGLDPFSKLWARRTSLELPDGTRCEVMSLPDLVKAKKTQRDKDWPMVRRLIEAHYFQYRERATAAQVRFWLQELRTPELLVETARRWPAAWKVQKRRRALLALARSGGESELAESLVREEWAERKPGDLPHRFGTIRRTLEQAVPTIEGLVEKARLEAQLEHPPRSGRADAQSHR
jgi:hypothetical protein